MNYNNQFLFIQNERMLPLPTTFNANFDKQNEAQEEYFTPSYPNMISKVQVQPTEYYNINENLHEHLSYQDYQNYSKSYPARIDSNCANSVYEVPMSINEDWARLNYECYQYNYEELHYNSKSQFINFNRYCLCPDSSITDQIKYKNCISPNSTNWAQAETKLVESFYNDPILNNSWTEPASQHDFKSDNQTRQSNLSKSKINAKFLKSYQCKIEERRNERGGVTTFYVCKYEGWDKEFTRTWSILDHVRMHEGVRPYVCKFCSRSYTQKGNMIKHMRRHTQPCVDSRRSYVCKFCGHGYTEKYNLKVI